MADKMNQRDRIMRHLLVTELVDGRSRYGEPTRYAVYRLAEVEQ